jgi:hypothetical protein
MVDGIRQVYIRDERGQRRGLILFTFEGGVIRVGASFLNPNDKWDQERGFKLAKDRLNRRPVIQMIKADIPQGAVVHAARMLATRPTKDGGGPRWRGSSYEARRLVKR